MHKLQNTKEISQHFACYAELPVYNGKENIKDAINHMTKGHKQ